MSPVRLALSSRLVPSEVGSSHGPGSGALAVIIQHIHVSQGPITLFSLRTGHRRVSHGFSSGLNNQQRWIHNYVLCFVLLPSGI